MSSSKTTWLALVALAELNLPDAGEVIAALAEQGGAAKAFADSPPKIASQTDAMVTLQCGEATAAYTLVNRPISADQLAGPCETAWYWPDAAKQLRDHRAHLFLTLVDEGRDAVQKSMRLTAFANAVASNTPARGIVWGPAGLVHEPAAFAQQAFDTTTENLPLFLWIDFRIEPVGEGVVRMFTTGLEAFERKELEVAATAVAPQQLLDDIYNVAHYVIQDESAVKDADTIGLSDGRQMISRHETSILGDDRKVVRLEYDKLS